MKILFIGDIVGNPGRKIVKELLPNIKKQEGIDIVIANGENSAGGNGITYVVAQELYKIGVDGITMGNHTWAKKEITNFIDSDNKIVKPANFPLETPGQTSMIINNKLGVLNLVGRVYMDAVDCPFKAADKELEYLKSKVKVVLVDIHAEATSEKTALAWYLDGRVSCVLGTHTHVQTADERILHCGTAFLTDVGMCGPLEGIIGVEREMVIRRFITHFPERFEVAKSGPVQFNAVVVEIDEKTGKSISIKRISEIRNL